MIKQIFTWFGGLFGDSEGLQSTFPASPIVKPKTVLNTGNALQVSTVWSCVDLISKTLASMPMLVYENNKGRRKLSRDCALWFLFHEQPNALMSPFEFWRALLLDLVLRGNAYAVIDRNRSGEAYALFPAAADQMRVYVERDQDRLLSMTYIYQLNGQDYAFSADRIWHLKGLGKGLIGLANMEFMGATIGEAISMQENASNLYGNGSSAKGILMVDRQLDSNQRQKIASKYANLQLYNESGLFILPADMTYQQVSLSPADSKILESRQFNVDEICRWFGVPKILIDGSSDKIDEAMDLFYKTTIRPLAVNLEQSLRKQVLTKQQKQKYICEFNLDAMLRASLEKRAEVYAKWVQNGIKTRNECRQLENDPPLEGGDGLTVQNNLVPIDQLGQIDPSQTSQKQLPDEIRQ